MKKFILLCCCIILSICSYGQSDLEKAVTKAANENAAESNYYVNKTSEMKAQEGSSLTNRCGVFGYQNGELGKAERYLAAENNWSYDRLHYLRKGDVLDFKFLGLGTYTVDGTEKGGVSGILSKLLGVPFDHSAVKCDDCEEKVYGQPYFSGEEDDGTKVISYEVFCKKTGKSEGINTLRVSPKILSNTKIIENLENQVAQAEAAARAAEAEVMDKDFELDLADAANDELEEDNEELSEHNASLRDSLSRAIFCPLANMLHSGIYIFGEASLGTVFFDQTSGLDQLFHLGIGYEDVHYLDSINCTFRSRQYELYGRNAPDRKTGEKWSFINLYDNSFTLGGRVYQNFGRALQEGSLIKASGYAGVEYTHLSNRSNIQALLDNPDVEGIPLPSAFDLYLGLRFAGRKYITDDFAVEGEVSTHYLFLNKDLDTRVSARLLYFFDGNLFNLNNNSNNDPSGSQKTKKDEFENEF